MRLEEKVFDFTKITNEQKLGEGHSGEVFKLTDAHGNVVAEKRFRRKPVQAFLSRLFFNNSAAYEVSYSYATIDSAVTTAFYRRLVLADLAEYWFGDKLAVAKPASYRWIPEKKCFALAAEFIDGRGPIPASGELEELEKRMEELKTHLGEAGFIGTKWQSDVRTMKATGNFLYDEKTKKWIWVDMESGSPAFPLFLILNLKSAFRDYLIGALKYGRYPLFDDIDWFKLREYLAENKGGLEQRLEDRYPEFIENVENLLRAQWEWKKTPMGEHMANHWLRTGKINRKEFNRLRHHPAVLYAYDELADYCNDAKALCKFVSDKSYRRKLKLKTLENLVESGKLTKEKAKSLENSVAYYLHLPFSVLPKTAYQFFTDTGVFSDSVKKAARFVASGSYREKIAEEYFSERIDWQLSKKRITEGEAQRLKGHLQEEGIKGYLGDFGFHLGIAGFMKAVPFDLPLAIWIATKLDAPSINLQIGQWDAPIFPVGLVYVSISPAIRTAYTLIKKFIFNPDKNPYGTALFLGSLPFVGSYVAYPLQMGSANNEISKFFVKETASNIGRHLPIWGGPDSRTELYFIKWADNAITQAEKIK